ncbi:MAG: hypothetical protein HYV06_08055 [Deltaproteobacteria bacterium]|nr:hypothetical protein [Deltaproteobacteria bacterium]
MSQALVNPDILRWARERSYLGVDMLAHKIGTKVEKVLAWEMGEALPTFKQLVPKNLFLVTWNSNQNIGENADRLARHLRVSTVVIARRALDLNLIDWAGYWSFYESERDKWTRTREDSESGGDFYRTLKTRNGTRFSQAVLSSAYEGRLLFREAAALLGTSVGNLDHYAKEMGVR